ncbi:hypothetical protein [Mycobacterium sp.]|uniref:hypothetical protein n=1 Tax=Mycobacterium sp. TaxID=1785 RepID=UPI003F9AEAE1
MTGPHPETESPETRPISVAELLARNGTIGAPAVTRRRRRRRGDSDAVSVAELTGEIPVIRGVDHDDDQDGIEPPPPAPAAVDEQPANAGAEHVAYWSEPEPRWPKSPPQAQRASGPQLSAYPRPLGHTGSEAEHADGRNGSAELESDAEGMSPDPADDYADIPVDVMDSDVREAEVATEDSAYVRSYLQASDSTLFGGQTLADELARRRGDEAAGTTGPSQPAKRPEPEEAGEQGQPSPSRFEALWRGSLVVLQSILAVVFGAGLFVAFDQLWRWNSIVALVLSVLVILGLVVGVRVVRKTEDIASTLIAVAVGALITLGPLALSLQSG